MNLNFNQSPYFDDFDETKKFHKILFKPEYPVQARELNQSQTIIQDQIKLFGDHTFQNHTPVSGGAVTTNLNVKFLKLNPVDQNNKEIQINDLLNKTISNSDGSVLAKVLFVFDKIVDTNGDIISPPVIILSYFSGSKFSPSESIVVPGGNVFTSVISLESEYQPYYGDSSLVSIDDGVFYIDGYFVRVQNQSIPIDAFSKTPSARIGIVVEENIIHSKTDKTLLNPRSEEHTSELQSH